jgi:hydrogenase expression/formation protein HypE
MSAAGDGNGGPPRGEEAVLAAIEDRRRRPRRRLSEDKVTLAHGAGGKSTRDLVEALFMQELGNPVLERLGDSAILPPPRAGARLAFTTDSYVVSPLFFPGGDIGELAVNGTLNDLAMEGARPLGLSVGLILEEGLAVEQLSAIAGSIGRAARAAGVAIAAGDTKVVERGTGDGVYVNTSGVGVVEHELELGPQSARPGDRVLVSGTLADHGMAIMVARGQLELEADLRSDTAALGDLAAELVAAAPGLRWMRDPTRGGLATALAELALASDLSVALDEAALPIRPEVRGACEILGIDPLYVANEGKLCAVVAADDCDAALAAMREHPLGAGAAIVGEVREDPPGLVVLETAFGGSRIVDMLAGDPLPRIC